MPPEDAHALQGNLAPSFTSRQKSAIILAMKPAAVATALDSRVVVFWKVSANIQHEFVAIDEGHVGLFPRGWRDEWDLSDFDK